MHKILVVFVVMIPFFVVACATTAPEPGYIVLSEREEYQVREYAPYLLAEVNVSGEYRDALYGGFRILFDYIDGNNSSREKVEMTAPVIQEEGSKPEMIPMTAPVLLEEEGETYLISFVMPLKYTMETIPVPKDKRVKVRQVEKKKVAVLSFSWYATEKRVQEKKDRLMELLSRDGYQAASPYRAAYYNPPWTLPFLRRNEILIDLK